MTANYPNNYVLNFGSAVCGDNSFIVTKIKKNQDGSLSAAESLLVNIDNTWDYSLKEMTEGDRVLQFKKL